LGLRNCVITSELRYSSLKITSMYARFAREKKRAMAEKLLGTPSPFLPMSVIRGYNPIGGGDTSEACVKEVSARTERRAKQTRRILSALHYETLLWIAERVAAEHRRTQSDIYTINCRFEISPLIFLTIAHHIVPYLISTLSLLRYLSVNFLERYSWSAATK